MLDPRHRSRKCEIQRAPDICRGCAISWSCSTRPCVGSGPLCATGLAAQAPRTTISTDASSARRTQRRSAGDRRSQVYQTCCALYLSRTDGDFIAARLEFDTEQRAGVVMHTISAAKPSWRSPGSLPRAARTARSRRSPRRRRTASSRSSCPFSRTAPSPPWCQGAAEGTFGPRTI